MINGIIIEGVRYSFVEFKEKLDDPSTFCEHCALKKRCSLVVAAPCRIFSHSEGKLFVRVSDDSELNCKI